MNLGVWGHPMMNFTKGGMEIEEAFRQMAEVNISRYYCFAGLHGKACYPSQYLEQVTERDFLDEIVHAAEKYGVEVHPVVAFSSPGNDQMDLFQGYGMKEGEDLGHAACPSSMKNQALVLDIMREVIERYPVKGIHLDYVRFPNESISLRHPCQCRHCRDYRKERLGQEVFTGDDFQDAGKLLIELQMRAKFVKGFVEQARALTSRSGLELSMAAREIYTKYAMAEGQDWVEWAKEGLVDAVNPMSYSPDFGGFQEFVEDHTMLLAGTKAAYYTGVGRNSANGEMSTDMMIKQIRFAMDKGADGCTIFHYGALTPEDFRALRSL